MWKQGLNSLRDGVKEFSQSALDEVKQGSSFVRASSASSELAESPLSSRSLNLPTGEHRNFTRHPPQAQGAAAHTNSPSDKSQLQHQEQSTHAAGSLHDNGDMGQSRGSSPGSARGASPPQAESQQSRRTRSRDASPSTHRQKPGHHRRSPLEGEVPLGSTNARSSSSVIQQLKAQASSEARTVEQAEASAVPAKESQGAALQPAGDNHLPSTRVSLQERLQMAEEALAAAEQERADMESSVTALAEDLEQRLQDMGNQLEARERQLAAARQELEDMEEGFHGNKRLLQQSGEERRRLAASEVALQEQLKQARAEAQQAQRENARHAADAAVARAEMQQNTTEQQQEHRQALETLRSTLQQEADLAKEGLQVAERRADAAEHQAARLHTSLATAEDRRRTAEAQAEAAEVTSASERDQRTVAEALAQQLQAEGARRANVFNAAVRSAVSKIQSQLEAERDELGNRVIELESQLAGLQQHAEAQSARVEAADAAAAAHQQQLAALEEQAVEAASVAAAATSAQHIAEEALQEAESSSSIHAQALAEADQQAAEAQERSHGLEAAVAAAQAQATATEAAHRATQQDMDREVQRWKLQAEAASRAARMADSSTTASVQETAEEANDLRRRVHDLQAEVADLQAALQSQSAAGPSSAARRQLPSDFLADLGSLDVWQGSRLRASASEIDLEDPKHEGKSEPWLAGHRWRWLRIAASYAQRLSKYAETQLASSSWGPGLKQMVATKGHVSGRFWLIAVYLVILHLFLMITFTKSTQPDLDTLCAPRQGLRLPG
ncbi:hypothetical protein WJX74_005818 [Apatococcus lobatus]|uniref:Golgin-84 n=1 Tax=Apatococcus lobatus TaxID=904363 RepID=A0AAW1SGT3_9CHLO